jgi:hypothetical protein
MASRCSTALAELFSIHATAMPAAKYAVRLASAKAAVDSMAEIDFIYFP